MRRCGDFAAMESSDLVAKDVRKFGSILKYTGRLEANFDR